MTNIKPGPELDRAVAEAVDPCCSVGMCASSGCIDIPASQVGDTAATDPDVLAVWKWKDERNWRTLPKFSTDLNAAFEAAEAAGLFSGPDPALAICAAILKLKDSGVKTMDPNDKAVLLFENTRLQAIVDKLPKTRDGVSVVPGVDQVFDGRPDTCHCFGGATDNPDRSQLIGLDIVISADGGRPTPDGGVPWKHAYSTADAARESAEAGGES